jgi:hypothetical protein
MSSRAEGGAASTDPDNRFLWHFNVTRMEAEAVRDGVLHVAGELDTTLGGPDIDHRQGMTSHRRSLYFTHHGEEKMQLLDLFDGASATECYRRKETVVPQQALALTNSEFSWTAARALAPRLSKQLPASDEPGGADRAFVTTAFEQVLTRRPTADEAAACLRFLAQCRSMAPATAPATQPATADPDSRAREALVHALLNHNDFVTIR